MAESGKLIGTANNSRTASARATVRAFPKAPNNTERYEMFKGRDGYMDFDKMEFYKFDRRPGAIKMMKAYMNGTDKTRGSIVEHLIDENYHGWADALEKGDTQRVKAEIDSIYFAKPNKTEKEFWKEFGL